MTKQTDEKPTSLAAALAKLQTIMEQPKKDTSNPFFKSKYADLAACFDAARKHFEAFGLAVVQLPKIDGDKIMLETIVMHTSGQTMSSTYPVQPVKNDPQGVGSAITYARRYAICAMLGITPEAEDDDGNAASGVVVKEDNRTASRAAKAKASADAYIKELETAGSVELAGEVIARARAGALALQYPDELARIEAVFAKIMEG